MPSASSSRKQKKSLQRGPHTKSFPRKTQSPASRVCPMVLSPVSGLQSTVYGLRSMVFCRGGRIRTELRSSESKPKVYFLRLSFLMLDCGRDLLSRTDISHSWFESTFFVRQTQKKPARGSLLPPSSEVLACGFVYSLRSMVFWWGRADSNHLRRCALWAENLTVSRPCHPSL